MGDMDNRGHGEKMNYDVILINPGIESPYKVPFPPFAFLFIAPKLAEAGYRVKIFDVQIEATKTLIKLLKHTDPIWVGFTVMTGSAIKNTIKIAKIVRKYKPHTPIVFGGAHPTLLPGETLKHPLVDIVVISEGEITVVELTKALEKGADLSDAAGIGFKKDGEICITKKRDFIKDWDHVVELDWSFIDVPKYINYTGGYENLPIITSRGCPFRCAFCYNLKAHRRRWRGWSAEKTIEEIKKLLDFGINYISFQDDAFAINPERVKKIAAFLGENNIKWSLDNGLRVSLLTDELATIFKDTNCDHLAFGAESGSQKILDHIKKDITVEQILNSAKITMNHGMGAKYSWMIGIPGEREEDIWATLDIIDKINEINPYAAHFIGIFSPYPGIELVEDAINLGWQPPDSLEGWSKLREEQDLPYVKNIWFLRAISFTCYLLYATNTQSRTFSQMNPILKIPIRLLRKSAKLRWEKRFFHFPLEYKLLLTAKNLMGRLGLL